MQTCNSHHQQQTSDALPVTAAAANHHESIWVVGLLALAEDWHLGWLKQLMLMLQVDTVTQHNISVGKPALANKACQTVPMMVWMLKGPM